MHCSYRPLTFANHIIMVNVKLQHQIILERIVWPYLICTWIFEPFFPLRCNLETVLSLCCYNQIIFISALSAIVLNFSAWFHLIIVTFISDSKALLRKISLPYFCYTRNPCMVDTFIHHDVFPLKLNRFGKLDYVWFTLEVMYKIKGSLVYLYWDNILQKYFGRNAIDLILRLRLISHMQLLWSLFRRYDSVPGYQGHGIVITHSVIIDLFNNLEVTAPSWSNFLSDISKYPTQYYRGGSAQNKIKMSYSCSRYHIYIIFHERFVFYFVILVGGMALRETMRAYGDKSTERVVFISLKGRMTRRQKFSGVLNFLMK